MLPMQPQQIERAVDDDRKDSAGSELPGPARGAHASLRAPGDGTQTGMAAAEQDVILVQPDRVSLTRHCVTQRDSNPGTPLDP